MRLSFPAGVSQGRFKNNRRDVSTARMDGQPWGRGNELPDHWRCAQRKDAFGEAERLWRPKIWAESQSHCLQESDLQQ